MHYTKYNNVVPLHTISIIPFLYIGSVKSLKCYFVVYTSNLCCSSPKVMYLYSILYYIPMYKRVLYMVIVITSFIKHFRPMQGEDRSGIYRRRVHQYLWRNCVQELGVQPGVHS